jgi:prepilin peptidase CpaA
MTIEFYSMVVGSVFVMGKLAWNGALFRTLVRSLRLALNPLLPKRLRKDVPAEAMTPLTFAPAILGATVVCFALVHR